MSVDLSTLLIGVAIGCLAGATGTNLIQFLKRPKPQPEPECTALPQLHAWLEDGLMCRSCLDTISIFEGPHCRLSLVRYALQNLQGKCFFRTYLDVPELNLRIISTGQGFYWNILTCGKDKDRPLDGLNESICRSLLTYLQVLEDKKRKEEETKRKEREAQQQLETAGTI